MKKAVIIMSGYNNRAVIAFLRVCEKNNIPYYIIATGNDDDILKTTYSGHIAEIRTDRDISKIYDICLKIKNNNNLDHAFIIPTTEYLNRYLLDNKKKFEKESIHIPLVDEELYENVSDKYKFRKLCLDNGINITKEYNSIEEASFPCILKPISYDNYKGKPLLINTPDEYKEEYKDLFYIEEYVDGNSYYLLFYFRKDGTYLKYSQQNLIQQPHGKSMIMAKSSTIHNEKIALEYAKLFLKCKFHGLVMVEVKKKNNDYLLIEANPRLWGPSQLMVDSNCKFFENYLSDMGFDISIEESDFKDSIYFWEDGINSELNKLTYYSYNKEQLSEDYENLHKSDLFDREDTKRLYRGSEFVKWKKN